MLDAKLTVDGGDADPFGKATAAAGAEAVAHQAATGVHDMPTGSFIDPTSATLGQRLRALRREQGLSQSDLAGDLVSPSYVSLIETGQRSPEREVLEGLARRLGCSVLYLESGIAPEEITRQQLELQFAEIALASGSGEAARSQFAELTSAANSEIRLAATWGLARALEALGDLHGAVSHHDALLDAVRSGLPGAPALLTVLMGRCRLYRDAGDFARSIEVGEDALREVRDLGLEGTEEEIRLASTVVGSYWVRGDLFSAQHLADQVIKRAERLGSRIARGSAYWNASLVAADAGQLTLALDLAAKTLALLAESSSDLNMAGMRVTYAWLLLRCDPPRFEEADALLARAHEVMTAEQSARVLANCETEMARSALLRGDFAAAQSLARASAGRFGEDGAAPDQESARVIAGVAAILSGDIDAGFAQGELAASRLESLGSRMDAAQSYRSLAEAMFLQGRTEQAIAALRKATSHLGGRQAGQYGGPSGAAATTQESV
jgi:transcriptional regulator with XRE-family HTH domain